MDKLDRLGWASGMSFTSFGVRVGVRVSAAGLLDSLVSYLPPGWKPASYETVERLYSLVGGNGGARPKVRPFQLLFGDTQRLARSENLEDVLEVLESDLGICLALMARHHLFVHAGVIGWKERAILIPGRSCSGKSTLVRAFLDGGATYYSDEFAVLDECGHVRPFARPLYTRDGPVGKQVRVRMEEFGAKTGVVPLPVGLVLLTNFQSGAQWSPRELTPGQGVLGLLSNTPAARTRPAYALKILAASVAQAKIWHGQRGEAHETAQSILRQLEN